MKVACSNCGTMGEEDAMRCTKCGTTLEYNDTPEEANTSFKTKISQAVANNILKKSNKAVIAVALVAIIVIGIIGAGIAIIDANKYKSVIEDKLYAIETLDAKKLADTYPEFIYNNDSNFGFTTYNKLVTVIEEFYFDYMEEHFFKELQKRAGDNLKFSYKIENINDLSDNKYKKFCNAIKAECDYNVRNITAIKKADITVKVKGSDDTYEFDWNDVYLIEDNGNWYLLNDDLEQSSLGKKDDYHVDYYHYFIAQNR